MSILLLAALQTAAPDIELGFHARVREIRIEQKGEAKLNVHAEPDAGSRIEVNVEPKAAGRTELRNVTVNIRGRASIADPQVKSGGEETRPHS